MFFIGVVTNQKNESYIKNKLSKILPIENIIFITDKNILNVKNIKHNVKIKINIIDIVFVLLVEKFFILIIL